MINQKIYSKLAKPVDELYVDVYMIGYPKQGESIIVIIRSENEIINITVIDSYQLKGINLTADILRKVANERMIDTLVWSHPHDDHTKGLITILDEYTNGNTVLVVPNIKNMKSSKSQEKYVDAFLEKIDKCGYYIIEGSRSKEIQHIVVNRKNKETEYIIKMELISPDDTLTYKYYSNTKKINPNHLTSAIILNINTEPDVNMLFSSDIVDETIEELWTNTIDIPTKFNFLSIPHHASSTSTKLLEFINQNDSEVACTTAYSTGKLPVISILNDYKKVANEVCCTSFPQHLKILEGKVRENPLELFDKFMKNAGVIKITYDIFNKDYQIYEIGDAFKLE